MVIIGFNMEFLGGNGMFISKMKIHNFKCYRDFEIDLEEGLNIIVGDNEAGKSTILEAINLALTGISVERVFGMKFRNIFSIKKQLMNILHR